MFTYFNIAVQKHCSETPFLCNVKDKILAESKTKQNGIMNAQAYTTANPDFIRRSFTQQRSEHATPSGTGHKMHYGDRIYARVVMAGRKVIEITTSAVNDLTELLGLIRVKTRGKVGLAHLYLRNLSRGWSLDRPMRLYSAAAPSYSAAPACRVQSVNRAFGRASMLMPWETH